MTIQYNVLLNFKANTAGLKNADKAVENQTNKMKKALSETNFMKYFFEPKKSDVGKIDPKLLSELQKSFDTLVPKNMSGKGFAWVKELEKDIPKMIDKSIEPTVALKNAFSKMVDLERFKAMGGSLDDYNTQMEKMERTVNNLGGNYEKMSKQSKKMSKNFDMSLLSMLFFGMALQRMFGGLLTQMVNTFKTIDKKGIMPLNRALTKLEAAWAFMSFSLIRSLEPILIPIIDLVVGLIDWFSQLPDEVQAGVGIAIIALAAFGGLLAMVGTVGLGLPVIIDGVITSIETFSGIAATAGTIATNIGVMFGGGAVLGFTIAILGLIGWAYVLFDLFKNGGTYFDEFTSVLFGTKDATGALTEDQFKLNREINRYIELLPMAISLMVSFAVNGIALLLKGLGLVINEIIRLATVWINVMSAIASGDLEGVFGAVNEAYIAGPIKDIKDFSNSIGIAFDNVSGHFDSLMDLQYAYNEKTKELWEGQNKTTTALDNTAKSVNNLTTSFDGLDKVDINAKMDSLFLKMDEVQTKYVDKSKEYGISASSSFGEGWASNTDYLKSQILLGIDPYVQNIEGKSPTAEGPLSKGFDNGANALITFSDGFASASPYLNETITVVFTDATSIMKSIVHSAVESVIADVNRALAKLRELEKAKNSSNSTNTTNNNNQKVIINTNSSSTIDKTLQKINMAVK